MTLLIQQLINAIELGSIYAMIAVGLALTYGVLRILHVAQAAVFAAGAYIGLAAYLYTGIFPIALVVSMLLAGCLGMAIERLVYRPMESKPRIVALIASIGLLVCFSDLFRILAGANQLSFDVLAFDGNYSIGNVLISKIDITIITGTVAILVLLWFILQRTKLGFAVRAAAQDIEATRIMGIDVAQAMSWMFFISSAIAAFGGVMIGVLYNAVYPNMGDAIAYKGLALIVIGGFGSLTGTVIASFLLAIAETFLTTYTAVPLSRDGIAMLFLVVLVMIRPQGLLGSRA